MSSLALALSVLAFSPARAVAADLIDLTHATIVVPPGQEPPSGPAAALVLQEELAARLGMKPA
jgi:hypothetical protein